MSPPSSSESATISSIARAAFSASPGRRSTPCTASPSSSAGADIARGAASGSVMPPSGVRVKLSAREGGPGGCVGGENPPPLRVFALLLGRSITDFVHRTGRARTAGCSRAGAMATPQGNDTVYVAGLPDTVSERDIAAHFGSIGQLKQDKKRRCEKIWLYRDRDTGLPKGDATVSYMDPHAAEAAVNWFNNTQFMGRTLSVSLAERKGAGRPSTSPRVTSPIPSGATPTPTTPRTRTRPPLRTTTTTTPTPGETPPTPRRSQGDARRRLAVSQSACGNVNFAFAAGATDAPNPGRAGAQLAAAGAAQLATFPPGGSNRCRSRGATGTGRARTRRAVTSTSPTGASATGAAPQGRLAPAPAESVKTTSPTGSSAPTTGRAPTAST